MVVSLLKGLAEEKIVFLNSTRISRLPFSLKGIVRLVDEKGNTLGLVLDRETIEEIEEEAEASRPEFLATLAKSRRSGRISGSEVKKKIGLK